MHYSNPRTESTIENWPTGRSTMTAIFSIETHPKRGQRAVRITHHPITGRPAAPKKLTFARQARIVDGDDGRTYILELSMCGSIHIMKGDMQYSHEHVMVGDARYADLMAMFEVMHNSP